MVNNVMNIDLAFCQNKSFDRDRGRPLGRYPSHTTRHAGPHRAVREVEVVDGYGQSTQAFLFYVPPNELHHELNRVGIHPSLFQSAPVARASDAMHV